MTNFHFLLSILALICKVCIAQQGNAVLAISSGVTGTTSATGLASVNMNGIALSYSIVATGLTGSITMAHFHLGAAGVSGPVIFTICNPCYGTYLTGKWPNTTTYMSQLMSAGVYINIHTAANPGGEIRGQVIVPFSSGPPYQTTTVLYGTPNPCAFGVATLSLTSNGGNLSYTIVATNLTGPITLAHFHAGAAGVSGGPIDTICGQSACPSGFVLSGTWANTSAFASALMAGAVYINLHTTANPGGEIRGQVMVGGASSTTAAPTMPPACAAPTPTPIMIPTPTPAPSAAAALVPRSSLVLACLAALLLGAARHT